MDTSHDAAQDRFDKLKIPAVSCGLRQIGRWLLTARQPKGVWTFFVLAFAAFTFWPNPNIGPQMADTVDYAVPAVNLLQGRGMVLIANGKKYPPEHSFGLSLLLTPAYAVLGPKVQNGVYVIFLAGLGAVGLTYRLCRRFFGAGAAFIACVFFLFAHKFRHESMTISTQAVSTFFCLAVHGLLFTGLGNRQSRLWVWLLLGQTLGYSATVRPDNALLVLPTAGFMLTRMRGQRKCFIKVLAVASGLAVWGSALLFSNYLYSGSPFRNGYQVRNSAHFDVLAACLSWRHLVSPSIRDGNAGKILRSAIFQWSLDKDEIEPHASRRFSITGKILGSAMCQWSLDKDEIEPHASRRYFYYAVDVLFLIGLFNAVKRAITDPAIRDFLVWMFFWVVALVLFFGCYWWPFEAGYLQRIVPYLCMLDAVGFVALWNAASPLGAALHEFSGSLYLSPRPAYLTHVTLWCLRTLLVAPLLCTGGDMWAHPFFPAIEWMPTTPYLYYVASKIPEKDAVLISNFDPFLVEHIIVGKSARRLLPLYLGITFPVQWHKPPHPEWITNVTKTGRYPRMYDNGAEEVYPNTPDENLDVIHQTLTSGKKVYLVTPGAFTKGDTEVATVLERRYVFRWVESGFQGHGSLAPQSRLFAQCFLIAQLVSRQDAAGPVLNTDPGQFQLVH